MTATAPTQDAGAYLNTVLAEYGLSSEGSWAWDQIVAGASPTQILQDLRQRPAYQDRFQGMALRQAAGLPAVSESEYIALERGYRQTMAAANMPSSFYDSPSDFAKLIGSDVSVNEVQSRVQNAYLAVTQAPAEVRQTFSDYFGVNGDSAFAAYVLDPNKAEGVLLQQAQQALIGGTAKTFGLSIGLPLAEQLVATGLGGQPFVSGGVPGQARAGFQAIANQNPLYKETVSETKDLRANVEGVKAQFGLDQQAALDVKKRQEQRAADFSGTAQGVVTGTGAIGVGTAGQKNAG